MSLVSRTVVVVVTAFLAASALAAQPPLRVCSEAANLPFSNFRHEGFENQMAVWIGKDLGRQIQFVWWPQRVRFIEKRLHAGLCDLVIGVPTGFNLMATSTPYYRSTYAFVSQRKRDLDLHSLHDPSLKNLRIGLHVIGDEMEAVPPARELVAYGMTKNIVGYSIYGRPLSENAPAELVSAVADGDIDVGIVWGPTAGYFAAKSAVPLKVTPICQHMRRTFWPLEFDISVGVRKGDKTLLQQVNRVLARRHGEIQSLLARYHVPDISNKKEGWCE